jgi:hypothetical protein
MSRFERLALKAPGFAGFAGGLLLRGPSRGEEFIG